MPGPQKHSTNAMPSFGLLLKAWAIVLTYVWSPGVPVSQLFGALRLTRLAALAEVVWSFSVLGFGTYGFKSLVHCLATFLRWQLFFFVSWGGWSVLELV